MEVDGIMVSKTSQTERQILFGLAYMWNLQKKKKMNSNKQRVEWWLPRAASRGNGVMLVKGYRLLAIR